MLNLELEEPPSLNLTLEPRLEPAHVVSVPMPDGALTNITVYAINETIRLGNVTIVVFGYVAGLGLDLGINVFGVPLGNYTVSVEGLEANQTVVEFLDSLHVRLYYEAPENQLIPEGTTVKIEIQPLNLTITIPVKG